MGGSERSEGSGVRGELSVDAASSDKACEGGVEISKLVATGGAALPSRQDSSTSNPLACFQSQSVIHLLLIASSSYCDASSVRAFLAQRSTGDASAALLHLYSVSLCVEMYKCASASHN